jgi:hypothetical protein
MDGKVSIEVDARHEGILRRTLAFAEEMEQLALSREGVSVRANAPATPCFVRSCIAE